MFSLCRSMLHCHQRVQKIDDCSNKKPLILFTFTYFSHLSVVPDFGRKDPPLM